LVPTWSDLEWRNSPYFAFFTEFDSFAGNYVTVIEDRPIMSVKYCLIVPFFHFWPKLTHPAASVSVIAELVIQWSGLRR